MSCPYRRALLSAASQTIAHTTMYLEPDHWLQEYTERYPIDTDCKARLTLSHIFTDPLITLDRTPLFMTAFTAQ